MRPGVTLEDITRAADQLLFAGERPTVEGVRQVLGTGSPVTVNRYLTEYYKGLKDRLTLPPAISAAAAELHAKIRATAQAAADADEEERQRLFDRDRQQLAAERAAFESERSALREQATTLTRDLERLRDEAMGRERQLAEQQHTLTEQTRRAVAAETQTQAAVSERERATQSHQAEVQRLRGQAEGNEKHFLNQIDQLRTENRRLIADKEKEQAAVARRLRELETQLATATTETATLSRELGSVKAELAGEREKRESLKAAQTAQAEHHAHELTLVKAQRDQAIGETGRHRQVIATLQHERDQALQAAALYQGKTQALQGQLERQPVSNDMPGADDNASVVLSKPQTKPQKAKGK